MLSMSTQRISSDVINSPCEEGQHVNSKHQQKDPILTCGVSLFLLNFCKGYIKHLYFSQFIFFTLTSEKKGTLAIITNVVLQTPIAV